LSQTSSIAATPAPRADVPGAIARAAQATGIDFSYLLAQARLESSLDPGAQAATSSAAGLYQFTRGTWLETLDRHGARHGVGWAQGAIEQGRIADPGLRQQVLALRFDPDLSARMAAELANDNRAALLPVLGREPDPAELYVAHFLGAGGAKTFLSALSTDPGQSAAALLPDAAAANRTIFYAGGQPRTVGEVMTLLRGKMERAMGESGAPVAWTAGPELRTGLLAGAPRPASPERPSMAATLAGAFGLRAGTTEAPAHVRAAYGKLRAFDL
jgi:hypothetical protein